MMKGENVGDCHFENEVYTDAEQRAKIENYNRLMLVDIIEQQAQEIKRLKEKIKKLQQ